MFFLTVVRGVSRAVVRTLREIAPLLTVGLLPRSANSKQLALRRFIIRLD